MNLVLDITPLQDPDTGIAIYTGSLQRELMKQLSSEELSFLYFGRKFESSGTEEEFSKKRIPFPAYPFYRYWSFFNKPELDCFTVNRQIYHNTNFFVPPSQKIKTIVTIHDIAFIHYPETSSKRISRIYSNYRKIWNRASIIITPSVSTKNDLIELMPESESRIFVVNYGLDSFYRIIDRKSARQFIKEKWNIEKPFLLHVGKIEPRKDHKTLFKAFEVISEKHDLLLICVGGIGWKSKEILDYLEKSKERSRIMLLNVVNKEDLLNLYNSSEMLVFPSIYEGFGLPVIESMSCGCPVITCNNSSLREAGGNGALYFQTGKHEELAECINELLTSKEKKDLLVKNGIEWVRKFNWEKAAKEHIGIYRSLE
ncbi:MAG: glycosyltransferase family 4 protein [Candidatus Coatesbacteria bacterium]|nr:glycosyltransferase family 4 protein [Candidatus Coatesbacteria bacterium]